MNRRQFLISTAAVGAVGALGLPGPAFAYPDRAIRVVVPNAPGGAADIMARTLQPSLQATLGQGVAVTNVPGGGNSIGIRTARDAEPDGYTALCIHQGLLSAAALGVMDFGPEALLPVAQVASQYTVLVVKGDAPYQDFTQFLAAAKSGEMKAGVAIGALNHLQFLMFGEKVGVSFRYVNTGGGGPTRTALAGGHVDCAWATVNEVRPLVDSGDLKVLGAFAPQRFTSWPELATAREQGVDHIAGLDYWWWMPLGTPADRADRFAEALRSSLDDATVKQTLAEANITPAFLKGSDLKAEIDRQYASITSVVERNNVRGN